eukprot:symbB.v1.2.011380.t1/scaffold760.1/size164708/1
MWGLELDEDKSYVWTTSTTARQELRRGRWRVAEMEKDLGASLAYGKKTAKKLQEARITSLEPLMDKLKKINAPEWQKQVVIKQALWPRELCGSSICRVGWEQISKMRTAGVRALRYGKAGASPAIRLFFLSPEQCDPGFYQLWTTWQTFRRVAKDKPFLRELWEGYMDNYTGQQSQGPFDKLLELGRMISWHIDPPHVMDHDGRRHHILEMDSETLYQLLRSAWTQKISWDLNKRKDMKELEGLDEITLRKDIKNTPAYKRKLLDALREGTFLDAQIHRKYDNTKTGKCRLRGEEDNLEHRCLHCPGLDEIRQGHLDIVQEWPHLPRPLREHLLPSRNPWEQSFLNLLHEQEYKVQYNLPKCNGAEDLHLFTDGSALQPELPLYTVVAWAVVNATEDELVCSQPLEGLLQTNDHAEVEAIYHAVVTAHRSRRPTTIWTDSSVAGQGLQRLLNDPNDVPEGRHSHQWMKIKDVLEDVKYPLRVQHVAAHRNAGRLAGDIDDWTAQWNARADLEASRAHKKRAQELERCRTNLLQHHWKQVERLRALRDLHWEITEKFLQTPEYDFYQDEDEEDQGDAEGSLLRKILHERKDEEAAIQELIPMDWADELHTTGLGRQFGEKFTKSAIGTLMHEFGNEGSCKLKLSWLEIAVYFIHQFAFALPIPGDQGMVWKDSHMSKNAGQLRPQTIAAIIRLVRTFCGKLSEAYNFRIPARAGINLAALRVHTPMQGCVMWITPNTYSEVIKSLKCFTIRRPIRMANDLCRPLQ